MAVSSGVMMLSPSRLMMASIRRRRLAGSSWARRLSCRLLSAARSR